MAAKKSSAKVLESKRGGIQSWDCSACGYFTHGDEQMALDHIAKVHAGGAGTSDESEEAMPEEAASE